MGTDWQIGLNGANTMACGLAEEIEIAGKLGYEWFEIRDWKLEEFLQTRSTDELRELFSSSGVKPLAMNAIEPVTFASAEDLRQLEKKAEWRLSTAKAVGCPNMVVNSYGAPKDIPEEEGKRQVVEGLKMVSDMASDYGVTLAYEFLGSLTSPFHTVAETMDLLQAVGRPNIGWLFDFYHFHVADGSLEALSKATMADLLLVHIDDVKDLPYEALEIPNSERVFPGEGAADTAGILRTLYAAGYRGAFSIELFNKEFLEYEPYEFARVAKDKTVAVLEKYFK